MISGTLFKRNMISSIKILVIIFAVISMYTGVIIYMYDPALAKMLADYQQAMPQMMDAVGMGGATSNLLEFVNTYLYGFIMLVFPMLFSIIEVNKLLMHYIDSGSLASLLATPNSRMKIVLTQWVSIMLNLTILIGAVTGLGIIMCQAMFPGDLDISKYLMLNVGVLITQYAIAAIIFIAACIFNESKKYYLVGAGLPLLFFLFQMLSNLGEKLENFKYVTIFTLFPANDIVAGDSGIWGNLVILLGITAVLSVLGMKLFEKRDLSL